MEMKMLLRKEGRKSERNQTIGFECNLTRQNDALED